LIVTNRDHRVRAPVSPAPTRGIPQQDDHNLLAGTSASINHAR